MNWLSFISTDFFLLILLLLIGVNILYVSYEIKPGAVFETSNAVSIGNVPEPIVLYMIL